MEKLVIWASGVSFAAAAYAVVLAEQQRLEFNWAKSGSIYGIRRRARVAAGLMFISLLALSYNVAVYVAR